MAVSTAGTGPPVVQVGDDALVFTMRELNQHTARIMKEIEEAGRPAVITRDGRFVAVIRPLAPGQAESVVLPEIVRQIANKTTADCYPPGTSTAARAEAHW